MTMQIGVSPGTVYTGDEVRQGKGATLGARGNNGQGKEYFFCMATANITNGQVVTINGSFAVTSVAAGANAGSLGRRLAVAQTGSVTASASTYLWCQIYGTTSIVASSNALPDVTLTVGASAGMVDDGVTSVSAVITGLTLTTTATGGFALATLNYPQFSGPSHILA